jgi:hypothetical protein
VILILVTAGGIADVSLTNLSFVREDSDLVWPTLIVTVVFWEDTCGLELLPPPPPPQLLKLKAAKTNNAVIISNFFMAFIT